MLQLLYVTGNNYDNNLRIGVDTYNLLDVWKYIRRMTKLGKSIIHITVKVGLILFMPQNPYAIIYKMLI